MAQFDFYDPKFQGLLTLASGLLAQSGWQPQRVGVGEAIGRAGMPAIQAMNQARRFQLEQEEAKKAAAMRDLQMKHLMLQIGQEEALPQQMSQWQNIVANIDQFAPKDTGLPVESGEPIVRGLTMEPSAQPTPLSAPDPNQIMRSQLLGPFAGGQFQQPSWQAQPSAPPSEPSGMQMTGPNTAAMPQELVTARQADALYDYADNLEGQLAKMPNLHPKVQAAAQAQIKNIRDRAERLDRTAERKAKLPKPEFEEFAVGGSPDDPIFQKFRVMPDGTLIAQKGTYKKKAGVEVNLPAATKYSEKFGGGMAEKDLNKFEEASSAKEGVVKLDTVLKHLQTSQAITGLGAELFKNVERARSLLMRDIKAGKTVSDTELLDAMLGSDVFPMIKSLGIGARGLDTPAEREFLRQVMSGTITMNKNTLIELAKIRRSIAVRAVEQWNQRLKTIPKDALEGAGLTRDPLLIDIPEHTQGNSLPNGWKVERRK